MKKVTAQLVVDYDFSEYINELNEEHLRDDGLSMSEDLIRDVILEEVLSDHPGFGQNVTIHIEPEVSN
jgi:hypothetical protein